MIIKVMMAVMLVRWQVQMMGDRARGHAFTRALLGLPATALHVCGDAAAWPLLQSILAETGDSPPRCPFSN